MAVATLGPDAWSSLWTGKLRFTDPRAVKVWDNFGKALDFTNPDAAGLCWQQAMDRVAKGESAFAVIRGTGLRGYLAQGRSALNPETTSPGCLLRERPACLWRVRIHSAFPRESGIRVDLQMADNDRREKMPRMLFNPMNGSISPRLDSDVEKYDPYFRSAIRDWRESRIIGSMAYGVAAPRSFASQFADVMSIYLASRDSRAAASAAQAIADQARTGEVALRQICRRGSQPSAGPCFFCP